MNRFVIVVLCAFLLVATTDFKAQAKAYPNELASFNFFGRGKLRALKLGESSENDIKAVFGDACRDKCKLNGNWYVKFEYFENEISIGDGDKFRRFVPKSQYSGRLLSITILPRKRVSLKRTIFPSAFVKGNGGGSGSDYVGIIDVYFVYQDKSGLIYTIFDKTEIYREGKVSSRVYRKQSAGWFHGDLVEIRYEIPDEKQEQMWIVKN